MIHWLPASRSYWGFLFLKMWVTNTKNWMEPYGPGSCMSTIWMALVTRVRALRSDLPWNQRSRTKRRHHILVHWKLNGLTLWLTTYHHWFCREGSCQMMWSIMVSIASKRWNSKSLVLRLWLQSNGTSVNTSMTSYDWEVRMNQMITSSEWS